MTLAIITHVSHIKEQNQFFAYAPYIREMNVWTKYTEKVILVAPKSFASKTAITIPYGHDAIEFKAINHFDVLSAKGIVLSLTKIPGICWQLFKVMQQADHIHLRCPGNVGLLGCLVQILFPHKSKTAKYAGNWDPKSEQPLSYRLQKWILSNSFLTRNMQVLVYGEWKESSVNIKPFFTASYHESDKTPIEPLDLRNTINFVFAGTLTKGKNPLYAVQLIEAMLKKGYKVALDLYGEGEERVTLERYIRENNLENTIRLKGNQNHETIKKAYQQSHFVVLPSQSEGWPKAIAEGMFWGCFPVASAVCCVPFMLEKGHRGIQLKMSLEEDVRQMELILANKSEFERIRKAASIWSRKYTLDVFEEEIKLLLQYKR